MLCFVLASGRTYGLVSILLRRENRKRDRGERDYILEGKTEADIARLGDMDPEYRHIY